jgi:hypothetical protein
MCIFSLFFLNFVLEYKKQSRIAQSANKLTTEKLQIGKYNKKLPKLTAKIIEEKCLKTANKPF